MTIRNILAAVDFSGSSDAAGAVAADLAAAFGARLHLVHVYDVPLIEMTPYHFAVPQSVWDDVRKAARERLEKVRSELAGRGVEVEARLAEGTPAEAIGDAARELGADLLVIGTRGHTGLTHALLGSVAERTLRTAPCPVLTVKEPPA